jgi:hypothetical protein
VARSGLGVSETYVVLPVHNGTVFVPIFKVQVGEPHASNTHLQY